MTQQLQLINDDLIRPGMLPDLRKPGQHSFKPSTSNPLNQALIIAHHHYGGNQVDLPNVDKDVRRVTAMLGRYGYEVSIYYELTLNELESAWESWLDEYAKPEYALFVYLTGHGGAQPSARDANWKNYVFMSGASDQRFIPFSLDNPKASLNSKRELGDKTPPPASCCVVCIDTCLTPVDGRHIGLQQLQRNTIDQIHKTHEKVTVFVNTNAESRRDDGFSRELERNLRIALREITRNASPSRQLQVTHQAIIQKFMDNRYPFVQTTKRLPVQVFQIDTLSFGQELIEHDPNGATINWVYSHLAQFTDSSERSERRWAWIALVVSPDTIKNILKAAKKLDKALEQQEPSQLLSIDKDIEDLETALETVHAKEHEYRKHLLNSYRLEVAMCRFQQYVQRSSEQQQVADLERDMQIIAEVFQGYDSSLDTLCNDLGYTREIFLGDSNSNPGLCRQLVRQVGVAKPMRLPAIAPTIYEHTKRILEACDPEQFADDIRLLDHINHYFEELSKSLAQLANQSENLIPASRPWLIESLYLRPTFWIIGIIAYSATLLFIALFGAFLPFVNLSIRAWPFAMLVIVADIYLVEEILRNGTWTRDMKTKTNGMTILKQSGFSFVVFCSLAVFTLVLMNIRGILGISLVIIGSIIAGVIVKYLGFQEYAEKQ